MSDVGNQGGDHHQRGRQYYVNTGHARQRQALYFNDSSQVDSLYGINVAKFDPKAITDAKHDIHITVPALICCGPDEKAGVPLCKPDCLPARPPSSPGFPLSNAYMGIKCPDSNPTKANNNTISYSNKPFRRRVAKSPSPSKSTTPPGQIKSAIKTDSPVVNTKKLVSASPSVTWTHSGDISKNHPSFTPDTTDPDSISFDPSTRLTATDPTGANVSHTSVNNSSSELSAAIAKTVTFPLPRSSAVTSAASCNGTDEDQDSNYSWDQEGFVATLVKTGIEKLKTGIKGIIVLELYLVSWCLLLLYMCSSCSAHTSVVLANALLIVIFWCEYKGYHCLVEPHKQGG